VRPAKSDALWTKEKFSLTRSLHRAIDRGILPEEGAFQFERSQVPQLDHHIEDGDCREKGQRGEGREMG